MTSKRRAHWLAGLVAAVVIGFGLAGCVTPASTTCADGLVCPPDSRCDDVNHRCLAGNFCGDGVRSGTEVCEGKDLGGETCSSLGFYGQTSGLRCADDCKFDTSGCEGRCGDGLINGTHEQCDGAPPPGKTCVDFGFDRGLLGCTELCGVNTDDCVNDMGWRPAPSTGAQLVSLWGSSPHDVFAAGITPGGDDADSETIVHWDGLRWKAMTIPNPSSSTLRQIWGSTSNDVWALGPSEVLHWNGAAWSRSFDTGPGSTSLQSIWGSRSDDVYVVMAENLSPSDQQTVILKWNGTVWSLKSYPPIPWMQSSPAPQVWQSGPDDLYVTIGSPTMPGSILHWAGTQWDTIKIGDSASAFTGIWGTGANDVYALSEAGAYHWDGTQWTLVPDAPGGYVIKGTSNSNIFIVRKTANDKGSTIAHWDGRYWFDLYRGDAIDDVWGPDPDNLYFTGPGGVFQPASAIWNPVTNELASSMWGTDEAVFLIGNDPVASGGPREGSFFGYTSKNRPFEDLSRSPGMTGDPRIWGTSKNDIWVTLGAGVPMVEHWDGSQWTSMRPGFGVSGVGGSGPNDVWAVGGDGNGGDISHWDGRAWSLPIGIRSGVGVVWAQSPDDAFAVGFDSINHWDGKTWSEMAYDQKESLDDVWGTGANDVYALGYIMPATAALPRALLHYDGTRWKSLDTQTAGSLRQIRASGPGNVFAIGSGGLFHLRAGGWESIALPTGQGGLQSLWVTSNSVYLSGSGGTSNIPPGPPGSNGTVRSATYRLDLTKVDCKSPETDCTDGWDNDCDGLQDLADPDCAAAKVTERCANLADDDGDGLTDCDDPDCAAFVNCRHP